MPFDDPLKDFDRYDAECAEAEDKRPHCSICDEPIWEDSAVYYNDQWVCKDCEHDFWDDIRDDFVVGIGDDE